MCIQRKQFKKKHKRNQRIVSVRSQELTFTAKIAKTDSLLQIKLLRPWKSPVMTQNLGYLGRNTQIQSKDETVMSVTGVNW